LDGRDCCFGWWIFLVRKFLSETFPEDEVTKIGMQVCEEIQEAIEAVSGGSQMNLSYAKTNKEMRPNVQ